MLFFLFIIGALFAFWLIDFIINPCVDFLLKLGQTLRNIILYLIVLFFCGANNRPSSDG